MAGDSVSTHASNRAVWVRGLAGTTREDKYYYWITDPSIIPAWVATSTPSFATAFPLILNGCPTCSSGTVEPLTPMASDSSLQFTFAASAGAIAVCSPDLAISGSLRRLGFLTKYISAIETAFEIEEEDGVTFLVDDIIYISGEIVRVTAVAPNSLTVVRGVLGTFAQAHSSPTADPTVLMDATRIPLRGQWLEYGVTDGGADTVLWRGVVQSASVTSSQTITVTVSSMLSVIRQTVSVVPQSIPLPNGRRAAFSLNGGLSLEGGLTIKIDEEEYPWAKWDYIRVIGASGDWAIIDLSTMNILSLADLLPQRTLAVRTSMVVPIIGSGDGIIRVIASGSVVRVRSEVDIVTRVITSEAEAATTRFNHCLAVLHEVQSVEWADITSVRYCADLVSRYLIGTNLPPRMSAQIPLGWTVVRNVVAAQMEYATASDITEGLSLLPVIAPNGPIADWIAGGLLRPGGLWMTSDLGVILIDTWQETARTVITPELTTVSRDDRGSWGWNQKTKALLGVQFDDPTSSLEEVRKYTLGAGPRGSLAVRSKVTSQTVTTSSASIISADAWVSSQRFIETVGAPLGLSPMQIEAWQSLVLTYGRELPIITSAIREELNYAPGSAINVQLDDAPTTRELVGMIYEVTRDPAAGTMTLSVVLPGVGRNTLILWASAATALVVGVNTMTVSGDDLYTIPLFVGANFIVYTPTGAIRGNLTGTGWTNPNTLTWTGGTATPLSGDIITLDDRTPVIQPEGVDGAIGYLVDTLVEYGDARWQ